MKAKFTAKGGYEWERERAKDVLVLGEEYYIEDAEVGSWCSSVKINDNWYNTALFENIIIDNLLKEFPNSKNYYGI